MTRRSEANMRGTKLRWWLVCTLTRWVKVRVENRLRIRMRVGSKMSNVGSVSREGQGED